MDSDPLRHLEFFSVPNNQTINPVDQSFSLSGARPQSTNVWDAPTSLNMEAGLSGPPSTAPTLSPNPASTPRPPIYGGQSRRAFPSRASISREGNERKRSRVRTEPAPFDSVDYWIQFDNDDSLADIPEGMEAPRPDIKGRRKASSTQRPAPPAPRRANSASSSRRENTTTTEEFFDDSALDNALSDYDDDEDEGFSSMNLADHLSKIDSAPPTDVPPREGLYSTPLSWEKPQPGLRMDPLIGLNSPALNEAEQRRLIAIAMNPGPSMGGLGSNLNFNFGGMNTGLNTTLGMGLGGLGQDPDSVSMQRPFGAQQRPAPPYPPKRQGSVSEKGKEKPKLGDRTAHNDIERKYRTNLKDRIAELRDAVPALHTISENGGDDDGSQPSRAAKVSKGTVLTKATEYIQYLERKNKQIAQEHRELSRRLQAFEQLLHASARATYQMPTYSRTLFDPRGFC
ncbi:helix-loop-helix DNA-binding domain-containing protein [Lasiosphaeria miniovina]|uniref:Helix-loop-helix DNA-binding domain-containing protein n=1 Tax=Lasiosphaeria miniovina TaxID=1954250 RepID=A0AA40DRU7_9PEZI|nr:helix-loop-helix DNA-binding domain-containing protein [Lasiosphaeria miniovina]KAK0709668.1 helix-loop-helix DNA-binding domain-containing protein [Lasiosphaeria miniovina]